MDAAETFWSAVTAKLLAQQAANTSEYQNNLQN